MANAYTPVFDEEMARRMVVSANENTALADTEFAQDISKAPYGYLVNKYGQKVADNRRLYTEQRIAAEQIANADRNAPQIVGDTALGIGAGFVDTVGSVVGTGLAGIGAVDKYFDPKNDGISRFAVNYVDTIDQATKWIQSFQSQELADRRGLSGIEAQLAAEDNLAQYKQDTAGRDGNFIDDLAWFGRGTLNNLGRIASDSAIAGDTIARGIGSLGPSAKIASTASRMVTSTRTFNAAKIANAIAPTQGTKFLARGADMVNRGAIAASVGGVEAAGVYSQTVNEILGMKHGQLLDSSKEYTRMIDAGVDPDDAKATLAANAGIEAFKTAFPMAASMGIIAGKFEAMPVASFRGSGFIGGLRQVGAETLEEGGQGFTGQIATNTAIRDTGVDPKRNALEGAPEAVAAGMIAGTGMASVMATPSILSKARSTVFDSKVTTVDNPAFITPEQALEANIAARETWSQGLINAATKRAEEIRSKGKDKPEVVGEDGAVISPEILGQYRTAKEQAELDFLEKNKDNPDNLAKAYGLEGPKVIQPTAPTIKKVIPSRASQTLLAAASGAATGLDAAQAVGEAAVNSRIGQAVLSGAKTATAKVGETVAPVVNAANEQISNFNSRPDRKAQSENLEILSKVAQMSETELSTKISPDQIASKKTVKEIFEKPAEGSVPNTFASTTPENSSNLSRVSGILSKLTEKGIRISKMSDGDVLYAAQEMQKLRNSIPNLPAAIQAEVKKVIASEDFKNVQKQATRIDLNKTQDPMADITPEIVQETKAVAATNPVNTNPEVIKKILEQDDRTDVTAADIKMMKVAKRIGDAIKSRVGASIKVEKNTNVELSAKPEYHAQTSVVEAVSRHVILGSNEVKTPSVAEFASQIMQGIQSDDGTVFINGVTTPVSKIIDHFKNFAQHMINKVGALNTSYDNRNAKGTGSAEVYENLAMNRKMQPGKRSDGSTTVKPVTYQSGSLNGVAFAREVHADATVTVEIYNAMAEAYPEQFPAGPLSVPELRGFETQNNVTTEAVSKETPPTAVEAETAPAVSNETQGVSGPSAEETIVQTVVNKFNERLKNKKTSIVNEPRERGIAAYSKKRNTVSIDGKKIIEDFNAGLAYIDGNGETTSEQKAVVFETVDVQAFKDFILEKGLETYVEFILEHELQHARQLFNGQVYPKDLMDPKAIAMERDANEKAFEIIGFTEDQKFPTLSEMMAAETRTRDDFSVMTEDQLIESANRWFVEEEDMSLEKMSEAHQKVVTDFTNKVIAYFNLPVNLVLGVTWLRTPDVSQIGQAMWAERLIGVSADVINVLLGSKETMEFQITQHSILHELMHIIDAYASNRVTHPESQSSDYFSTDSQADGRIYKEVIAATKKSPYLKAYFEYALSYDSTDMMDALTSEIFAEIGALYLENPSLAKEYFPEGVAYVESVIEKAGGTIIRESEATDGSTTQESNTEETVSPEPSMGQRTFENVNPKFNEGFQRRQNEISYANGEEIITMVEAQPETEGYVEFVRLYHKKLMDKANERLATIKTNKTDDLTIKERILNGEDTTTYRRNKNTMMVDQTTGEYDPDLLSIAALAVLDWLSGVRALNSKSLNDTMEDMGLTFDMVSEEEIQDITYGVPPRDVVETLSKDIVRMWGLSLNRDTAMVDARGAIEGLVKELLESLIEMDTGLIQEKKVPYFNVEKQQLVKQSVFNVFPMVEMQKAIGMIGQNAVKKMLAPELDTMPSIGAALKGVDQTQSRGGVKLSKREKKTLYRMQNQGHSLAESFASMVEAIGFDPLASFLGKKDFSFLSKRHPLRASIAGKNLSIELAYQEAMSVVNAIRDAGFTINGKLPEVFYRVGISLVGRHQFKGINPQNNKILRALVTPTKAVLNMTTKKHKDAFWLTVAQAADISGFNKVENQDHKYLLDNIQTVFFDKFGDAVEMATEYLNTGVIDGPAFIEAMGGEGSMQQMSAVLAVAALEKAKVDGTLESFETTLSFELDGKTDGPGNMMANFGQGMLTVLDFMNFKRVGFFLGTKTMTLNQFYGDKTQHDLYEVTSLKGQDALYNVIAHGNPDEKERFHAVARFASAFGDLKIVEGKYVMTRNTSKNPMTKTVYGSSERGVGQGLAQDMMIEMYRQLIDNPDGIVEYPGGHKQFVKDFEMVFQIRFPRRINWNKSHLSNDIAEDFTKLVTRTLGKVLSNTAKGVIGNEITKVNDTLVLMTAFQTEYLTAKFKQLLDAKVKERAAKNETKEDRSVITQRDYDEVVNEIRIYSPTYANGMQTLDIGAFTATDSGIKLSESMTGGFQMPSSMVSPKLAGVKVIPYVTQGRGDAMMMNRIYGGEFNPEGTLPVFDGIDMPIDKITDYAQEINKAVLENWEADVLGDIVKDITGFLEKTAKDGDLLAEAWSRTLENAKKKKTTATATTPEGLIADVIEMQRLNQARKTVFKKIGISVDHMGGSDTAFVQGPDGLEYSLGQINDMIREELGLRPVQNDVQENADSPIQIEDSRKPVEGEFSKLVVTDAATMMDGLLRETRNKPVAAAVRIIQKANLKTRIVIGSPQEVSDWYSENIGDMNNSLRQDKKGIYDPVNDVILITDNNHETIVHELIHAATFQILENFYNGSETKNADTIARLETLAEEFMNVDFSGNSKKVQDAANSAKAQILFLETKDDAFSKAAALNEFMAWTLSSESLMKELGQRPTSLMQRMTSVVKALMQRLLGGIKSDILSNIQFNTELLVTGEDVVEDLPAPIEDTFDELTPNAQNFTNFWIDLAKQRLEEARDINGPVSKKLKQIHDYRKNAQDALDILDMGGFNLSAYQKETFKAIHMVLALEMRLDIQSAAALNSIFEHVTNNLTPEMFGPINAQDRYSSVMEIFGGSKNEEGVSDAIAVLLALSQTSQGFRNAIDQLPVPEFVENVSIGSVNDFLGSLAGMLMNKAVGSIDISGQSVSETLDQLSSSILQEESEREFRILSGLMSNIDKADAFMNGAMKKLAGYTETVNEELRASNRSRLTKVIFGAITAATAFLDQDRAEIQAEGLKRVTHMGTNLDWAIFVREFVTEMVGTDENNRRVTAMLDEVTYAASNVRQNYREDLPVIFQNTFDKHPDEAQWRATHKVMGRTDFAAVYDETRPNASFEMFKDENIIDTRIAQAEAAIRSNFSIGVANTILEKGQQLADFMNGKGAGHQLWRNGYAINKMAGDYKPSMNKEIDQLITLYAMKGSDPLMRQEVTRMYEHDPIAMQNLAVYMKALNKEEDLKTVSDIARMNGYKGYIPDLGRLGSKVIIAKDENRYDLEKKGYKRVADAPSDDGFSIIKRGYYVTNTKQTGTYSQGVMQIIQDTYRGVDATTGLSVNGNTSGLIAGAAVEIVTDELNKMTNGLADNKEALLPVYDEDGVVFYERAINPDIMEKFTAPKSNLALMLGAWAGRQIEEKFSQKYNQALIDELKHIYDTRGSGDDGLFVNLPEEAMKLKLWNEATKAERLHMKKPDQIFVDSWNAISPQTKRYIEEVFGENSFYVRKDQMNLALGYRDPSVIDMWTGNTRVPDSLREGVQAITGAFMGKNAMKAMAAVEGGIQGVVSTAKDLIVVRSLVIPYMNTQANVVQLSTRGVPMKAQTIGYKNKLSEIEQFNKNRKKLIELETRIQLAGTDANKVRILKDQRQVIIDQNARFSIAPLIKAGAYKNISEGLTDLDVSITSGRINEWIENQVNRLPNGVRTIAKYGLLSKDTALYKGANKAVQYGDFIAKSIYYDHLTGKGLSQDDAMKLVNEEFVNFSFLPGRTRTYLEGIGATWFLSFKIRIMKIAMNQVRENPARSLILAATVADFGSPQADNLASVITDDRIGYALGWEMLFSSAGLNPWLNLYD